MSITKEDFHKGQKLYLKPSDSRDYEKVATVHSVGRKFVYLDENKNGFRIDLSDKYFLERRFYELKDFGVRGRFFFSEKEMYEYEKSKEIKRYIVSKIDVDDMVDFELLSKMKSLLDGDENV